MLTPTTHRSVPDLGSGRGGGVVCIGLYHTYVEIGQQL